MNVGRRLAVRNARLDLVDHNTIDEPVPSFEDEVATLAVDESRRRAFEQAVDHFADREYLVAGNDRRTYREMAS